MPHIDLDDYSGIIVGGSPFNTSDPDESKSAVQLRVEAELGELIEQVMPRDFPFFGACYGIGLLANHLDGVVDGTWPEGAGPARVTLTAAGTADPLFSHLGESFDAFVGHKEACTILPSGAVLLASGTDCPVQAFRIGSNVYATQFHPELTEASILTRIRVYRENGYFDPAEFDDVAARIRAAHVTEPLRLVRAFVERFAE